MVEDAYLVNDVLPIAGNVFENHLTYVAENFQILKNETSNLLADLVLNLQSVENP
tara:strand:+ start:661 stop:825 length:165 start_codon:yes stop_codon:yes gene_type:complete